MFAGNRVSDLADLVAMELEQSLTLGTVQVVMLRVAVIVFVNAAPIVVSHFAKQSCFYQFSKRAIDCRPTYAPLAGHVLQLIDEVLGLEMLMSSKHLLDDDSPLRRATHAARLQKLVEPLNRRE